MLLGKVTEQIQKGAAAPSVTVTSNREINLHYNDESVLTINATVSDNGSLSYQWYKGSTSDSNKATAISGATNSTYSVSGNSESETYYWCKVTNSNNLKTEEAWSDYIYVKISNIVVVGDDDISGSPVWNADYTYLINYDCYVSNKLTIPAGTVVKFEEHSSLNTDENGIIIAKGEAAVEDDPATDEDETKAAKPVIFTAATDNTVGITIPAYKDSTPEEGYWEGLSAGTQGSVFDNCVIRYAGSEYFGALKLAAKTTVTNCTFTDNATPHDTRGALNIEAFGVKSTVTGNTFYNNAWPLSCPANFTVDSSNVFHKDDLKNTNQAIRLWDDNIESNEKVTWGITEVPYYADEIDVWGELTIADGVIVRFAAEGSLAVFENGKLTVENAILTSYRDDANGGDIFADGDSTADESDWKGVWIEDEDGLNNSLNKDSTKVLYNEPVEE